jgi:hypothetical protein
MTITYKTVIFPEVGHVKGKTLQKITNWDREFNDAIVDYLKGEGITDAQGIVLPGGIAARNQIAKARLDAGDNKLRVRAGLTNAGALVMSIDGTLPAKKTGGKPVAYDASTIVRKDFAKFVTNKKNETNVIVNLTKDKDDSPGDRVINNAVRAAGTKFKVTTPQTVESLDVGGLTTGTVILTAHGSAVAVSGTVLGTELGQRTPEQIVALLTKNTDKRKRLSKKFSGTVLLSGCYTASGSGKVPYDPVAMTGYNYSTFAGQVLNLLRAKGYDKLNVQGTPGPSKTSSKDTPTEGYKRGDERTVHSMLTTKGAKALKQQLTMIEDKLNELKRKHNNDDEAIGLDEDFILLSEQFARLKKERKAVLKSQDELSQAANRIANLMGTFGLKVQ